MKVRIALLAALVALTGTTYAVIHSKQSPAPTEPVAAAPVAATGGLSAVDRDEILLQHREMRASRTRPVPAPSATVIRVTSRRVSHHKVVRHAKVLRSAASAPDSDIWYRLAQCEASGDWHEHGSNGFYGGLQFTVSTWRSFGGTAYAWRADYASPSEQILVAKRVLAEQGWAAWPACSRKLGLR